MSKLKESPVWKSLEEHHQKIAPLTEGEENENFEVADAPVGATVPYLSDEAKETTTDGRSTSLTTTPTTVFSQAKAIPSTWVENPNKAA